MQTCNGEENKQISKPLEIWLIAVRNKYLQDYHLLLVVSVKQFQTLTLRFEDLLMSL